MKDEDLKRTLSQDGIPNVRMTLSDKILGDDFKYKDYYSGVGKENATNVIVDEYTTMKDLLSYQLAYTPIKFDRKILLKASPIKLRKEYET